jgi:hypothetical protein
MNRFYSLTVVKTPRRYLTLAEREVGNGKIRLMETFRSELRSQRDRQRTRRTR